MHGDNLSPEHVICTGKQRIASVNDDTDDKPKVVNIFMNFHKNLKWPHGDTKGPGETDSSRKT